MFQEKVTQLLNDFLETRKDLFLIDLSISETKAIKVVLDGDNGVSVEDCVAASRAIEHQFDRVPSSPSRGTVGFGARGGRLVLRPIRAAALSATFD